jgi:UDP-2,3-diacylglucosamine pyrophosphatase LpxH
MLTILNDTHIGVERSAGTTVLTKGILKNYVLTQFGALLPHQGDLMILGDLFDKFEVNISDAIETIRLLLSWLDRTTGNMYLVAGNHDLSKTSGVASSLDLVATMLHYLRSSYAGRVVLIKEPTDTPYGYVIPHLPNQEAFDAALEGVPECDYLFLHVNYDNKFAAQSDQSLNITKEQVEASKAKHIICGHEHQHKHVGKIRLPGNQIATSVSDWQGCSYKYGTSIDEEGVVGHYIVMDKSGEYTEQLWTDPVVTNHKFVRMVGNATAEQAAQVVSAVAKFRSISPALVVTNAVQIASNEGLEGFSDSLESVRAFDVWAALGEVLDPAEIAILHNLE